MCPQAWREAKVIPLPRIVKPPLLAQIADQSACYQQTTDLQHAYREGHSTSTALTEITDDWLREIDDKKIVGAVLLDFSVGFDIIKHSLLWLSILCYIVDKELPV